MKNLLENVFLGQHIVVVTKTGTVIEGILKQKETESIPNIIEGASPAKVKVTAEGKIVFCTSVAVQNKDIELFGTDPADSM